MYERLISPSRAQKVRPVLYVARRGGPHQRLLYPQSRRPRARPRVRWRHLPGEGILPQACARAVSSAAPQVSHESLLSEIFGIDIAAFPAQLSTINLAVRHLSDEANYPRVARDSFFNAQAGIPLYDIPLTGDAVRSIALEQVDAVVGNPPYIRQEGINKVDKDNYRNSPRNAEWPGQTGLDRGGRTSTPTSSAMPPICSRTAATSASLPASDGWTPSTASGSRNSSCATSGSSRSSSRRWRSGLRTRGSPLR